LPKTEAKRTNSFRFALGAAHKGRPHSRGEGGLSSADNESLQMRTSALFGAKTPDFSKFMASPYGQRRGVEPLQTFFGQGGGGHFLRFCADVFFGRPIFNLMKLVAIKAHSLN